MRVTASEITPLAITVAALRASVKTWACPASSLSILSSSALSLSSMTCSDVLHLLVKGEKVIDLAGNCPKVADCAKCHRLGGRDAGGA